MAKTISSLVFIAVWALVSGADLGTKATFTANVLASTANLGGVNCLVDATFDVEDLASNFIYDIQVCNVRADQNVKNILKYSKAITTKTDKVIDADDNVCKNAAYEESQAKKPATSSCSKKMQTLMGNLYDAVATAYNYLNTNLNIEDTCSEIAANALKTNLGAFTESVGFCATIFK